MTHSPDQIRMKRAVVVIYAVAKKINLQAHLFLGPQNPRDAKGNQARYAVWWVCYYRLGMTQAEIGGMFTVTDAGVAAGIHRVPKLAPDSLTMCQAMQAAELGAKRAAAKYPLNDMECERVARLAGADWMESRKEKIA